MNQIEHWKARETGLPADAAYHNRLAKRLDSGLPGHLGRELVEVRAALCATKLGYLCVQMQIRPHHIAANGYLHAGSVVTLVDMACGFGCLASLPNGARNFTTIELKTNFLRTATNGSLRAEARLVHSGRRTQVWDATVSDENDRTLALFRCSQMILYPDSV